MPIEGVGFDAFAVVEFAVVEFAVVEFAVVEFAVVEPRRVRVYGGTFAKACEVAEGGVHDGTMERRVEDLMPLLDSAETMALEPLTKDERNDPKKIASAYGDAYEALP